MTVEVQKYKYNSHLVKPGMRFGRLTVLYRTENGPSFWRCICDCGERPRARRMDLLAGTRTECYRCSRNNSYKTKLDNSLIVPLKELINK